MKKRIGTILLCLILCFVMLPFGVLGEEIAIDENEVELNAVESWALPTLDGPTITSDTYADKIQLLVFYRGRFNDDGSAMCTNSSNIIQSLAKAKWIKDENIQVIAVESDYSGVDEVRAFTEKYAPNCDDIVFAYSGASLMWRFIESYYGESSARFAVCAVINNGELYSMDKGIYDAASCGELLSECIEIDFGYQTTSVTGCFCQSEARSMLTRINELRTGDDAWYWSSDNEKIVVDGLQELQYDNNLEQIAMARAQELVLYFAHTRPTGKSCFSLKYNGIQSYGENIAAGYRTEEAVFKGWAEAEEDYYGQGHRRNMLNSNYTAVGKQQ